MKGGVLFICVEQELLSRVVIGDGGEKRRRELGCRRRVVWENVWRREGQWRRFEAVSTTQNKITERGVGGGSEGAIAMPAALWAC